MLNFFLRAALLAALIAVPSFAAAQTTGIYAFEPHAVYAALEGRQPVATDPQMFVSAGSGVRGASLTDDPFAPALNSEGKSLGFTIGQWFAAAGNVQLTGLDNEHLKVTAHFDRLVPGGRYSLFKVELGTSPKTTPLDNLGQTNSFNANKSGTADVTLVANGPFTHAVAIVLAFHSDGADHGFNPGLTGVDTHDQLIYRFP
jgi:hypothetical protein